MFSKHVWFDRAHLAEVYLDHNGLVSGTIVAFKGAVCLINPRPEVLTALYQEARLRRILGIGAVIITEPRMDYTRGLCSLVGYSRGLRRNAPLAIISRKDARLSPDFLSSCTRITEPSAFPVEIVTLTNGHAQPLGDGSVRFHRVPGETGNPCLVLRTPERTIHYYDETHHGEITDLANGRGARPDAIIRAADLSALSSDIRGRLIYCPSDGDGNRIQWPLDVVEG
jgi:hypothetical protein